MIIPFEEMLKQAQDEGYIVGYFETWDVYSLEAVIEAAEDADAPVIIGFGGHTIDQTWFDGGGLERLGSLGLTIGRQTRVPVSLLLNEARTVAQIVKGIKTGFNAVMLGASGFPEDERLPVMKLVVEISHANGVGVEGETGELGDSWHDIRSEKTSLRLSDAHQAMEYVAQTGVDALSVAIGNIHLETGRKVGLNWEQLEAIHAQVKIPLVLHGGSSLPENTIGRLIALGVTKINVGTVLKKIYFEGLTKGIAGFSPEVNMQHVLGCRNKTDIFNQAKTNLREEVKRRIRLYKPINKTRQGG